MNTIEKIVTKANILVNEKINLWLIYPLIGVMVIEVFSRYFFNKPTFFAYELTWMLYAAYAILACGYGLHHGSHIKADVIYNMLSEKKKAIVDLFCYIIFFFPAMIGLIYSTYNMMIKAIMYQETSTFTNWAPSIVPIKIILFLGMVLLLAQGCVKFINIILYLAKRKRGEVQ